MYKDNPSLAFYMNSISKYPLISIEREKELSLIINDKSASQKDRDKAVEELVLSNLRLVIKIAFKIYNQIKKMNDINLGIEDMIQAGNLGLIRASELYTYTKGAKFGYYAYVAIRHKIMFFVKSTRLIRIPDNYFKHMYDINLLSETDRANQPNNKFLAKKLHVLESTIESVQRNKNVRVAMGDVYDFLDRFDTNESLPSKSLIRKHRKEYVFEKIKELRPKYRQVIFYKFFSHKEISDAEIAHKLNLTREAIRVILRKALRELRMKIKNEDLINKCTKKGVIYEEKCKNR